MTGHERPRQPSRLGSRSPSAGSPRLGLGVKLAEVDAELAEDLAVQGDGGTGQLAVLLEGVRVLPLEPDGHRSLILEALEEQVVVLRLLAAQQEAGKVTVRIGHETEAEQMLGTSVVSTAYGSSGKVYGGMGVVGPTRMDYPGTIANVAAVALYIGEVLGTR